MFQQIKETKLDDLKYIAIQAIFLVTFGLASLAKWKPVGIPQGFREQFGQTWLAMLPGGLALPYYTIAITETTIFVLFIVSFFKTEWLKTSDKAYLRIGLILSLFIFAILSYGLRLTAQFDGTANIFFYFGVTLFALYMTEKEVKVHR